MANTWNYRVIRHKNGYGPNTASYFQIHEVHYKDGTPTGVSQNGARIGGDDLEEIKRVLEKFKEALGKPILNFDAF